MNPEPRETLQRVNYILRMERKGQQTVFRLHNLISGERWEGGSWKELRKYLEKKPQVRLR